MSDERPLVRVIACAVLRLDLETAAEQAGVRLALTLLPGGLHATPRELRRRLQEAVDEASSEPGLQRIAIGYGVCGMGAAGIHARGVSLALPRVHDCIALFLGSDAAYRRQFAACPGTFYISAGWVDGKSQPRAAGALTDEEFAEFVQRYGEENTVAIRDFLSSWQKHYKRSVFIDTGAGGDSGRYERMAADIAREFGWRYERLQGGVDLLVRLLRATASSDEVLVVPPGHVTVYDASTRRLTAVVPDSGESPAGRRVIASGQAAAQRAAATRQATLGLGIDAGGTYTDAVIYDFAAGLLRGKAKAPTTRWDYAVGIEEALARLAGSAGVDPELLPAVDLVALSTTFATNAIVEGRGQAVGLLVMPPYGRIDASRFRHHPVVAIRGRLEIDGTELEPVDLDEVRQVAREMVDREGVQAFAVAGYASHNNPAHELAVKRVLREETGLGVTCGYEVSEGLNYRIRAETAALNARIIPVLEQLLADVRRVLEARGIRAPVMVVRSDGSLMSLAAAFERPIETALSGPAASVAGAQRLTGLREALVLDMGGTTSDTARLVDGIVEVRSDGATIGGWKTHVRALAMRTRGLGGDSLIRLEKAELAIGPRRVLPVCALAAREDGTAEALSWLERRIDAFATSTEAMALLALTPGARSRLAQGRAATASDRPGGDRGGGGDRDDGVEKDTSGDDRQRRLLAVLSRRPHSLHELASVLEMPSWRLLTTGGLEESGVVQRCGLTPTDLLHAAGRMALWDCAAAARLTAIYASLAHSSAADFVAAALLEVERALAAELLHMQLEASGTEPDTHGSPLARVLLDGALGRAATPGLSIGIRLEAPVIGIGAPVHQFLPQAAALLGTTAIVPPDADVANAIGAITGSVVVRRHARIRVDESGIYRVRGLPDAPQFEDLAAAESYAVERLRAMVAEAALHAGTLSDTIEILSSDQVSTAADGSRVFLGRTVEARLSGAPALPR